MLVGGTTFVTTFSHVLRGCCYGLGVANAMCFAHANLFLYVPKFRLNVRLVAQETSLSECKSALHTAFTSAVLPSLFAAGYAVAQPYMPFSYTVMKCLVFLTGWSVGTTFPPKGSNVFSAASGVSYSSNSSSAAYANACFASAF